MAVALELEHDPSGRNTLAGIHNVFAAWAARSNGEEFVSKPESFKPLPDGAKAIYFLELKGPQVITEANTIEYLLKASRVEGRYSFMNLLKNHVFASPATEPLLAWNGPDSNYGFLAATKSKPRANVLRVWDLPNVVGPQWHLTTGCWTDTATLQNAVSAAGLSIDAADFGMSVFQLGMVPASWPAQ